MTIYEEHGYKDRNDYLTCLAEDYGIDLGCVIAISELLGPGEDFDGLVSGIQDYAD